LIHQGSGGFSGAVPDIEVAAREALTLSAKCIAILAAHSGQPYEKVKQDSDRDYYMSAQEAKEYGLIDEVLEAGPVAAAAMGQPEPEPEASAQGAPPSPGRSPSEVTASR
jgi:ATP-dependent Clp protease protease subunit